MIREKRTLLLKTNTLCWVRERVALCAKVDCIATYLSSLVSRFFNNYNSIGSFASLYCHFHWIQFLECFLIQHTFFSASFVWCLVWMRLKEWRKAFVENLKKFFWPYLHLQNYISFCQSDSQFKTTIMKKKPSTTLENVTEMDEKKWKRKSKKCEIMDIECIVIVFESVCVKFG